MNTKFLANQCFSFAKENLETGTRELMKNIVEGTMMNNGELDEAQKLLKEIFSLSVDLKDKLKVVREIDTARQEFLAKSEEKKELISE